MIDALDSEQIITTVRYWVETIVVGLNLCPFAKHELSQNRIRFTVTTAITEEQLLLTLQDELDFLNNNEKVETTLLIHPNVLQDFYEYNQFLNDADSLVVQLDLEGIYQVASFHPDYQFGGTEPDDAENYTNKSPYPMLHLLREESLERGIANYSKSDQIPMENVKRMEGLGSLKMQALLQSCFEEDK